MSCFKMWNLYVTPICSSRLVNQMDLMGLNLHPSKVCLQGRRCTSANFLLVCGRSGGKAGIRHG